MQADVRKKATMSRQAHGGVFKFHLCQVCFSVAGSFMKDEVLPARIDHGRSKFWRCLDDKSLGSRSCSVADMTC